MKRIKVRNLILAVFLFQVFTANSQAPVKYDKNFKFKDGIYLTFEDFKQNRPAIASDSLNGELQRLLKQQGVDVTLICLKISVDDLNRNREESKWKKEVKGLLPKDLWGICVDGVPYVSHKFGLVLKDQCFFRIFSIGSISRYFTRRDTPMEIGRTPPTPSRPGGPYTPNIPGSPGNLTYSPGKIKFKHYAIDYITGEVLNMSAGSKKIIELIKRDSHFSNVNIKKRDIDLYITQYNKRNPIKFSSN